MDPSAKTSGSKDRLKSKSITCLRMTAGKQATVRMISIRNLGQLLISGKIDFHIGNVTTGRRSIQPQ